MLLFYPIAKGLYKTSFCSNRKPLPIPKHLTARFYKRDNAEERLRGCFSAVRWGLPICFPLALAFAIPERTRLLIIASSNCLNTPAICRNASPIGSALPSRQSSVIDPTMTRRKCFSRTVLMISHSCWVLLARRETSGTMMLFSG